MRLALISDLHDLGCACLLGNHDEFMLAPELVESYSPLPVLRASIHETRTRLSADDLAFIRGFQRTLAIGDAFLYHGTPTSTRCSPATTPRSSPAATHIYRWCGSTAARSS